MNIIEQISGRARKKLFEEDIVDEMQLVALSEEDIERLLTTERDRRIVSDFVAQSVNTVGVATSCLPLTCGLLEPPKVSSSQECHIIRSYRSQISWESVDATLPPLARLFVETEAYPSWQRHGSCASHSTAASINLRGMHSIDPLDAPSRRWLHVTSGRVGAHGRNQGRSYLDLQRTLFEHGFLLERELPTGRDDFDELETYSDDQIKLASKRRSFGAIWLDDIDSRLNAGLDLAHGIIPSYPIAVQIAVKLYSNWARFFKAGVIGRHNSTDTMLGGHAMMLLGFIAFREKTWAILANSWGPDFGMYSPKDLVGCALVSTDYLKEILYHGAVAFFQHRDEFERTHRILTNGGGATDQVESKFPLTRAAMITLVSPLAVAGKSWWTKTMRSMGDESRSRLVR